jgi:hypothetical protein
VRHLTERDYGIDCLIEPVDRPDGAVRGDLLAIQLKGIHTLTWTADSAGDPDKRRATFSGIDVATVNYWMGLPVPTFLCVHEVASDSVFFAPVKRQVRRGYARLGAQQTFGFEFRGACDLTATDGPLLLHALYVQERSFPAFAEALADLIENREGYANYIEEHVGRDFFMEVELPELVTLFRLFKNVCTVVQYSGWSGHLPSLPDLVAEDQRLSNDRYVIMHEGTQTRLLTELLPAFLAALRVGHTIVTDLERDFWDATHFLLVRYADTHFDGHWLEAIDKRLSRLR